LLTRRRCGKERFPVDLRHSRIRIPVINRHVIVFSLRPSSRSLPLTPACVVDSRHGQPFLQFQKSFPCRHHDHQPKRCFPKRPSACVFHFSSTTGSFGDNRVTTHDIAIIIAAVLSNPWPRCCRHCLSQKIEIDDDDDEMQHRPARYASRVQLKSIF
jgi:hypothetical protein